MAAISTFHYLPSIWGVNQSQITRQNPSSFPIPSAFSTHNFSHLKITHKSKSKSKRVRSSEEEAVAEIPAAETEEAVAATEQNVAVPVSASEKLIMFFQAEGTMSDAAIPGVTRALEDGWKSIGGQFYCNPSRVIDNIQYNVGTLDTYPTRPRWCIRGTEGISDLIVQISEGIASVELTKKTTIQATGVASALLEAIQGAGFKLQTLNLSFEDDELAYN